MLEVIKKLDSATIKALIVATVPLLALIASFFNVDRAVFDAQVGVWTERLLGIATLGGIAWAAWARLFKPTPPLTETAKQATLEAVKSGTLSTVAPPHRQGGFLRLGFAWQLAAICVAIVLGVGLGGCSGTKAAFEAAQTRPETVLPDTAYVLAEQYRAIVKEAADLRETGRLPPGIVEKLQQGANALKPAVLGDPQAVPPKAGLRQLALTFQAVRSASTEAELQRAVDDAVLAIADFIRTLEDARRVAQ